LSAKRDTEYFRERVRSLMPAAWSDLSRLVAFRSVANPLLAPREESRGAASFLEEQLRQLGIQTELQEMPDKTQTVIASSAAARSDAARVLLYGHYDVQPAGDEQAWLSNPWKLTDRNGRWYGRGAADSKGNVVAHLTALRALEGEFDCNVCVVVEGSEEWPSAGLETFVETAPDVLRADAILLADSGSPAVNEPAVTTSLRGSVIVVVTVRTLEAPVHSGSFGGAAPDALAALIRMLDVLWDDAGNATTGEDFTLRPWSNPDLSEDRFRRDAGVLEGVNLMVTGRLAERIWLRPAVTVIGIDCPSVADSLPAIPAAARARIVLRVPPGMSARAAEASFAAQLRRAVPWNARVEIETQALSEPYAGPTDGPALMTFRESLADAYERRPVDVGQGGSIPVCSAFHDAYPQAEILVFGAEEPLSAIHSPNESVDPGELERIALAECLFLHRYRATGPVTTY